MPSPATIVAAVILVAVVALVVRHMWKNRKVGGCSSCGGCGGARGSCHEGAAQHESGGEHGSCDCCHH